MTTLWDLLPIELEIYIREIKSTILIQKTYRKNRYWYFHRLVTMRRLFNSYSGRGYRCGDRVLLICKDRKLQYGTIYYISSKYACYSCYIILADGKTVVYYNNNDYNNNDLSKYTYPKEIIMICILSSWNYCVCKLCNKCDMCIVSEQNRIA